MQGGGGRNGRERGRIMGERYRRGWVWGKGGGLREVGQGKGSRKGDKEVREEGQKDEEEEGRIAM